MKPPTRLTLLTALLVCFVIKPTNGRPIPACPSPWRTGKPRSGLKHFQYYGSGDDSSRRVFGKG